MNLSVGIIGLTNVGKSTLFNALCARRLAETAPRPFTTIEPHEAVVPVPDGNLEKLAKIVVTSRESPSTSLRATPEESFPPIVPATVTFIDIAGLVKGAHKGEGLGNRFLAKIREVDTIVHVVRAFEDPGSLAQILEDIEIVNIELELGGITGKPTIYVLNVSEDKINNLQLISGVETKFKEKAITICAGLEEELIDFEEKERRQYLKEIGVAETGLERLILHAYQLLNLITFYTIKGGKEVRAWGIKSGKTALDAAAAVHTDFAKNFIKAEVTEVDRLLEAGSWKEAKEKGWVRLEGRDYVVADKDVIEFKVSA